MCNTEKKIYFTHVIVDLILRGHQTSHSQNNFFSLVAQYTIKSQAAIDIFSYRLLNQAVMGIKNRNSPMLYVAYKPSTILLYTLEKVSD